MLLRNSYKLSYIFIRISGCFGKLGSVTTDIVTPLIYRGTESMSWAFWLAVFLNIIAFVFIVVLNLIDKVNDKRRKEIRA